MEEVPRVGILAALAVQVRAGAFRTPQERMVVDEFARLGVFAVPLGFGTKGPDHLRVAADATFADVEVASLNFERRVRFDGRDGRHVAAHERRRHELDDAADETATRQGRTGWAATRARDASHPVAGRPRTSGGASVASSRTSTPCRAVRYRLKHATRAPARYSVPPRRADAYIGASRTTVSRKFGYRRAPSAVNSRHIRPCVIPATYIGIA